MIKQIAVRELWKSPNSKELFDSYYQEGNTGFFDSISVQKEVFNNLEDAGILDVFAIFSGTIIVGFIIASTSISPHYGKYVTTVMSIFVLKEHRSYGAAKELLALVEEEAEARGSSLVMVSSPVNATLGRFVTKLGYRESNILYGKVIDATNK